LSDSGPHRPNYLRLIRTAPQLVICVALYFGLCGGLIVWSLPNTYQSVARVNVDIHRTGHVMPDGAVLFAKNRIAINPDIADLARRLLATTDNLEEVASKNNLLLDVNSDLERKNVLRAIKGNLSLSHQRRQGSRKGTQDIAISYRDINAERSLNVLRSFLDLYLTDVLDDSTEDHSETLAFLDEQIGTQSKLLIKAEHKMSRFRTKYAKFQSNQDESDLSAAVFTDPEIQSEFSKLNQNYKSILERLLDFVGRRTRADAFVACYSYPAFEVVAAPRIVPGFGAPNRPLLFTLVAIGACVLGLVAPILRYLLASKV